MMGFKVTGKYVGIREPGLNFLGAGFQRPRLIGGQIACSTDTDKFSDISITPGLYSNAVFAAEYNIVLDLWGQLYKIRAETADADDQVLMVLRVHLGVQQFLAVD